MEAGVTMHMSSSKGFSLLETVIAIGVLTTGVLGVAGVLVTGMKNLSSSPADVVVTQKAVQAIESVFSARDSGKLTWTQIKNVSSGGVFLDGLQPMNLSGVDGLVNTADDVSPPCTPVACTGVETVTLPGPDQILGTADDTTVTLSAFQRQIAITDVAGENGELRMIVVTVTYDSGSARRTYTLTTFISAYS
jgi:type II secretory pathway pseudopilin PulG